MQHVRGVSLSKGLMVEASYLVIYFGHGTERSCNIAWIAFEFSKT